MSFDDLLALHKSERNKSLEKNEESEGRESVESGERVRHVLEAKRDRRMNTSKKNLYFPVSSQVEVKRRPKTSDDCLKVYQFYRNQETDDEQHTESDDCNLGFFSSREAMKSLIGKYSDVINFNAKVTIFRH